MSRNRHATIPSALVCLSVLGAWLIFALMVIAISWGGAASRGRPFDLAVNVVWNLGWILWAGATFGVQALARRFPLERRGLGRKLLLHVGLGLLVTTAMLGAEYGLNEALSRLWAPAVRPNPFVSFVVYKFHIYFLIYWLILGASGAYDYYTQLQTSELTAAQLETQLAQAQLLALRMQLHPHFLFNTHHSIISLMLKNENASAIKMLTRLSDLLRVTLKKNDQPMNSLREELEILELYLGIQRERYRERLTVEIQVEADTLASEVPGLVLQPLVENALQHGIDPQTSGGRLSISARHVAQTLEIVVRDNGPGLPPGFALEANAGIGLGNTQARLRRLYGEQHLFEIVSATPSGTEARLALPFRIWNPGTARRSVPSPS